jgi:hypothetical protein
MALVICCVFLTLVIFLLMSLRLGIQTSSEVTIFSGTRQWIFYSALRIPHSAFQFPPWTRVQIISPESGTEVAEGETGLLRVFDLANVYSVMAVQTEDLAIRRGDDFELLGRAALAEPRGCSLMPA